MRIRLKPQVQVKDNQVVAGVLAKETSTPK